MRFLILSFTLLMSISALADERFEAIRNGDLTSVQTFLDQGLDPNLKDANGDSLVIHTLRFNQSAIRKLICDRGAKDSACSSPYDQNKSQLLIDKIKDSTKIPAQDLEALLMSGADPSYNTASSRPALWWAVAYSRLDVVQLLLKYGAYIDMNYRETGLGTLLGSPLVWALQDKNIQIADLLLNYGANPAVEGIDNAISQPRNAFVLAAVTLADEKILARLLRQSKKEELHPQLVKFACGFQRPTSDQIKRFFPIFLSFGIDINFVYKNQSVVGCLQVQGIEALQSLSELGVDFSLIKDLNLMLSKDILQFLVNHGAKASIENLIQAEGTLQENLVVNAMNTAEIYKNNPGIFAPFTVSDTGIICGGKAEDDFLKLLIRAGFDVNARVTTPQRDGRQTSLLELCLREPAIRQILLQAGADPNLFDSNRAANSVFLAPDNQVLSELLAAGGNLNLKNNGNMTAAWFMLRNSRFRFDRNLYDIFKKYGLDFSILSPDSRSYAYAYLDTERVDTALFAEVVGQFPAALSVKGPNPMNARVSKANPLFFLLYFNDPSRTDLLNVFIKNGADLNSQETYRNETFLHGVMDKLIFDHPEWLPMFEMALRAKADPDIKNSWGESARSIAKARNRADLIELMNRYSAEKVQ